MDDKIKNQLEADVQPEDFSPSFQPVVDAIGVRSAIELCKNSGGIQQYIPLYTEALEGARNRAIAKEFDGTNHRRLAWKYDLAESTVRKVLARNRRSENKKMLEEKQESLF